MTGPLFKGMQWISNFFLQPLTFKYRFRPLLTWVGWKWKQIYLFHCQQNHCVWFVFFVRLQLWVSKTLPLWFLEIFLVQQSENLGIMSYNLLFFRPFFVVCFLLSHSVTSCFSPARSSPLSFCLAPRSLSTLLAEAFRESFLAGWLGWWIICSTNLLRLSLPLFDPASASHTVKTVFHWIFPVFCPYFSFSVTAQGAQMKQTCLTFPPLEIYKRSSWFHFTLLPLSDS